MTTVFDFTATTLGGTEKSLVDFRGAVLLIVNTASQCGFTPQYEGLQRLYEDLHGRDFAILGFPCNQFGKQEPGSVGKIDVNGESAHPLYKHLKHERPGLFGTERIKWNFTKFLVNREGRAVARY